MIIDINKCQLNIIPKWLQKRKQAKRVQRQERKSKRRSFLFLISLSVVSAYTAQHIDAQSSAIVIATGKQPTSLQLAVT
jgi:hypothetical protein